MTGLTGAILLAASALLAKKVSRIILVRPAVEAGEKLGFLPGDLEAKIQALTLDQVNAAFRKHIDASQISIVKAGDFKAAGVYK